MEIEQMSNIVSAFENGLDKLIAVETDARAFGFEPRPHLLMQVRTATINNELDKLFRGWYPDFQNDAQDKDGRVLKLAA